MIRRLVMALMCAALICVFLSATSAHAQQRAFGKVWGGAYGNRDWERFYHYPYVFYPQNFWSSEYYRSADHMYFRYPPEMRIPVYNRQWHNYYPEERLYHSGHHFVLDTF